MPVPPSGRDYTSGFGAMANVLEGYLEGEAVSRERFVEERDYAFEEKKFDEKVRQYDETFEESVRQFDTSLSFRAEQAALDRDFNIMMQDDRQDFMSEETRRERVSREEHQQRRLGYDYHQTRLIDEAKAADRSLLAEREELFQYKNYLGDYDRYSDIPDYLVVNGSGGASIDPSKIDLVAELDKIMERDPSSVIKFDSPGELKDIVGLLEAGDLDGAAALLRENTAAGTGARYYGVEVNRGKEEGLERLARRNMGYTDTQWDKMTEADRTAARETVVNDLENVNYMLERSRREELEHRVRLNELESGSTSADPASVYWQGFGQYFYTQDGRITYSGLGGDTQGGAAVARSAANSQMKVADFLSWEQNEWDPSAEDAEAVRNAKLRELDAELNSDRGFMESGMVSDGQDKVQAAWYYDAMKSVSRGEAPDYSVFNKRPPVPKRPSKNKSADWTSKYAEGSEAARLEAERVSGRTASDELASELAGFSRERGVVETETLRLAEQNTAVSVNEFMMGKANENNPRTGKPWTADEINSASLSMQSWAKGQLGDSPDKSGVPSGRLEDWFILHYELPGASARIRPLEAAAAREAGFAPTPPAGTPIGPSYVLRDLLPGEEK